MKKCLLIVLLFVSANIFAQNNTIVTQRAQKEYYINNNGDKVFSDINKIDLDKIKLKTGDILNADSIKAFLFENVLWSSYKVEEYDDKKKDIEYVNIFLPQIIKGTIGFKLGNWGKALGTKHSYSVLCMSDGITTLYEIDGNYNSGTFSSPTNALFGGSRSTESTLYIKNNELGVTKMHYSKKNNVEANQKIIEVLKKYTADKPQISKQLDNNFSAKYKNVKEYLEEYIQSK